MGGGMCGSCTREECRNDQIEFIFLLFAAAAKTAYYQHVQKVVQTGNIAFKRQTSGSSDCFKLLNISISGNKLCLLKHH